MLCKQIFVTDWVWIIPHSFFPSFMISEIIWKIIKEVSSRCILSS